MFQFSRFAQYSYVFTVMWPTDVGRVSPFGNFRIKASLQAPRNLSHATTSFIASHCLGIHRMRLFTWPYNPNKSVLCAMLPWLKVSLAVLYRSAFLIAFFCLRTHSCVLSFSLISSLAHAVNCLTLCAVECFCVNVSSLELVLSHSIVLFYKMALLQISKLLKSYSYFHVLNIHVPIL